MSLCTAYPAALPLNVSSFKVKVAGHVKALDVEVFALCWSGLEHCRSSAQAAELLRSRFQRQSTNVCALHDLDIMGCGSHVSNLEKKKSSAQNRMAIACDRALRLCASISASRKVCLRCANPCTDRQI